MGPGSGERGSCLRGKLSKGIGTRDCEVREGLAVELDTGALEPVDHPAVAEAVETGGGVYADDPQFAKVALPVLAVLVRVAQGMEHAFVGPAEQAVALPAMALGKLEDFLMAAMGGNASLDTTH